MNYKVEIIDKTFVDIPKYPEDSYIITPRDKTAVVIFFDNHLLEIERKEFGYVEKEEIYNLIDSKKEINLNYCYINNFSLNDFRKTTGKEMVDYVELIQFSAIGSFFDCTSEVNFSFAKFSLGDLKKFNFTRSMFGNGNIIFYNAIFENGNVVFNECHFGNGDISFADVKFGKGHVNFKDVQFGNGIVEFYNTMFYDGDADFRFATFGEGDINFCGAKFGVGNLIFERVKFGNGNVYFNSSVFNKGHINFYGSEFCNGIINFPNVSILDGDITFSGTKFRNTEIDFSYFESAKLIEFENVLFNKSNISFYNANITTLIFKDCQFFLYVDLRVAECKYIELTNAIVRDIIDFNPDGFVNVNIKKLNIIGLQNLGRLNLGWLKNNVKEIISNQYKMKKALKDSKYIYIQEETTHGEKAEQFRTLKENFHKIGQYDDEDKAYVEFRKHEMRAVLEERTKGKFLNKFWAYPLYWISWFVKDWLGSFGTNPWRVLANMGIIYILFSFIYFYLPKICNTGISPSNNNVDVLSNLYKSFYHSAITFLTIGYGDYYPSGIIRLLSGIEGFIGLFLMAYFVVAFSRKVLR